MEPQNQSHCHPIGERDRSKHYLDSLSIYPYLPERSFILDIGSGAGFPGIPLKIVQPTVELTLIDSVRKKVDFQRHVIRILDLREWKRSMAVFKIKGFSGIRGRFDIILSRAFSDLQSLLALSLPFLKRAGTVIAMKGEGEDEEIRRLTETEGIPCRLKKPFPWSFRSVPSKEQFFC